MYVPEIASIPRKIIIPVVRCGSCPMSDFDKSYPHVAEQGVCVPGGEIVMATGPIPDTCPLMRDITQFPQLVALARSIVVCTDRELHAGERAVINWQYGFAGDFFRTLFEALMKADGGNTVRLFNAFPEEVLGFVAYGHTEGWWPAVQNKARLLGIL